MMREGGRLGGYQRLIAGWEDVTSVIAGKG
jgi:hypothetical protein